MMSRVFLTLGLLPGKRWFRWLFRHRLPGFPSSYHAWMWRAVRTRVLGTRRKLVELIGWIKTHVYGFKMLPPPPQVSFSESGSLGNSSGSDVTSLSSQLPDTPNSMVPSPIDTWWEGHPPRLPSSEQSPQWNPIEFVKEKKRKEKTDRKKERKVPGWITHSGVKLRSGADTLARSMTVDDGLIFFCPLSSPTSFRTTMPTPEMAPPDVDSKHVILLPLSLSRNVNLEASYSVFLSGNNTVAYKLCR